MADHIWYHRGPEMGRLPHGQEPQHGQPMGSQADAPLGIYITLEAADLIGRHLTGQSGQGAGGILLGHVAQSHRPFVLVSGALEARFAEVVGGSISLNERSWEYMHTLWRRDYPGTLVIGWFFSHPNKGIELTSYDRFTQHRFFTHPWQVALAVDTEQNISQFYGWHAKELRSLNEFVIWDAAREPLHTLVDISGISYGAPQRTEKSGRPRPKKEPISVEAEAESAATQDEQTLSRRPTNSRALSLLVILTLLGFLVLWPGLPWSLTRLWSATHQRQQELHRLQEILQRVEQGQEQEQEEQGFDLSHITAVPQVPIRSDSPLQGMTYRVQPGDTLWAISKDQLGDPLAYPRIATVNDIENPALIHPGTYLTFPPHNSSYSHDEAWASEEGSVSDPARVSGQ
jgi:LysM repeat protein